jgi:hypothetical protein
MRPFFATRAAELGVVPYRVSAADSESIRWTACRLRMDFRGAFFDGRACRRGGVRFVQRSHGSGTLSVTRCATPVSRSLFIAASCDETPVRRRVPECRARFARGGPAGAGGQCPSSLAPTSWRAPSALRLAAVGSFATVGHLDRSSLRRSSPSLPGGSSHLPTPEGSFARVERIIGRLGATSRQSPRNPAFRTRKTAVIDYTSGMAKRERCASATSAKQGARLP